MTTKKDIEMGYQLGLSRGINELNSLNYWERLSRLLMTELRPPHKASRVLLPVSMGSFASFDNIVADQSPQDLLLPSTSIFGLLSVIL